MRERVIFDVIGLASPQGSKSAYVRGGRAVIVDGSSKSGRDKHAQWRGDVCAGAMAARKGITFEGAVEVRIAFYMPLVASDPYRSLHTTSPDIDKLVRSVLDSLTNSGLIRDDSLVCSLHASKEYQGGDGFTGATITVIDRSLEEADRRARLKDAAKAFRASQRLAKKNA